MMHSFKIGDKVIWHSNSSILARRGIVIGIDEKTNRVAIDDGKIRVWCNPENLENLELLWRKKLDLI